MKDVWVVKNTWDPTAYDLYVDGDLVIEAESFTIVDRVANDLTGNGSGPYGECEEVADSIRRRERRSCGK